MKRPVLRLGDRYRAGTGSEAINLVKRIGKYAAGPATDAADPALLVRDTVTDRLLTQAEYDGATLTYRLAVNVLGVSQATITVTNTGSGAVVFSGQVVGSWASGPLPTGMQLRVEASPISAYTTPDVQTVALNKDTALDMKYTAAPIFSAPRSLNPNEIPWEVTRVLFSAADLDAGKHGPVLGDGSIQLNPRSVKWDTPGQPTVVIPDGYGRPLRFDRWDVFGGGAVGGTNASGMVTAGSGGRLIFTETTFHSRIPRAGYAGAWPSRVIDMASPKLLDMTNCSLLGRSSGVRLTGFRPTGVAGDGMFVRQCYAENIDGRRVNADGTQQTAEDRAGKERVNFLKLDDCFEIPFFAEYNWVHKNPFVNSDPEDIYGMFASSPAVGTGYVRYFLTTNTSGYDPRLTAQSAFHGMRADGSELPFFGGSGLAGDGGVMGGRAKTASNVPHDWIYEYGYVIGGGSGYYLGIPTGNHSTVRFCKLHCCGVYRNPNSPTGYLRYYRVGPAIYVIDYWLGRDQTVWGQHEVTDNTFFVATTRGMTSTSIKWYPKSYVSNTSDGVVQDTRATIARNTALSNPGTRTKTAPGNDEYTSDLAAIETMIQREEAMQQEWHDTQAAAGRVIGVRL